MRVEIERSGGFANIRRTFTADAAALDSQRASELAQLVDAADLGTFPENPTPRPSKPDRFSYRITVAHEGSERSVMVSEDAASAALLRLVDWVQRQTTA
jgi:Emfourin